MKRHCFRVRRALAYFVSVIFYLRAVRPHHHWCYIEYIDHDLVLMKAAVYCQFVQFLLASISIIILDMLEERYLHKQ